MARSPRRIMTPVGSDQSTATRRIVGAKREPGLMDRNVMVEPTQCREVLGVMITLM